MNDTTLDPRSAAALTRYLSEHEQDIADEINDFGDLKPLFKHVFRCEPQPSEAVSA